MLRQKLIPLIGLPVSVSTAFNTNMHPEGTRRVIAVSGWMHSPSKTSAWGSRDARDLEKVDEVLIPLHAYFCCVACMVKQHLSLVIHRNVNPYVTYAHRNFDNLRAVSINV
ncbi:hypothetical protein Poly41_27810 [Novipirellula artificiosorum]|uniref:Uncharacterized protein n=1 Tax=Novipirellula artificiosorum TaxID=2528016 RepID=A0A5C6DPZ7_9BACT|nr:hypothetical protein Poly41_27810 [Novipirellula artificiosorum]